MSDVLIKTFKCKQISILLEINNLKKDTHLKPEFETLCLRDFKKYVIFYGESSTSWVVCILVKKSL